MKEKMVNQELTVKKVVTIVLLTAALISVFPLVACQPHLGEAEGIEYVMAPSGSTDFTNGRFIPYDALNCTSEVAGIDRWYTYLGCKDTWSAQGISGELRVYENDIDSGSSADFIAFALTLVRPTDVFYESFELGYYQDNSGYWLYSYSVIDGYPIEHRHGHAIKGQAYSLKILEVDERFEAYIDETLVDYVYFSPTVKEFRMYASQGESTDPTNPMRGHFWNLMYQLDSWHSWTWIKAYQDEPYYTRLGSTDEYYATIMGDINLNYVVEMLDGGLVSAHWYNPPFNEGILGYADKADLNHNGWINIVDVTFINAHWGESW